MKIVFFTTFLIFAARANIANLSYKDAKIYTDNASSFSAKLALIESATQSIDLCYFIIDSDYSTSLLMKNILEKVALARSSNNPLRVRILVDYFMSEKQLPFLRLLDQNPDITVLRYGAPSDTWKNAMRELTINGPLFVSSLMAQDGAGLKKALANSKLSNYLKTLSDLPNSQSTNPLEWTPHVLSKVEGIKNSLSADPLLNKNTLSFFNGLIDFLHRTHHKLLLVDGVRYQMGGRNLSDEYHADVSDVLIKGNDVIPKRTYAFNDLDITSTLTPSPRNEQTSLTKSFEALWFSERNVTVENSPADYTIAEFNSEIATIDSINLKAKEAVHLVTQNTPALELNLSEASKAVYLENKEITEFYIQALDSLDLGDEAVFVNAYFFLDNTWVRKETEALSRLYQAFLNAAKRGAKIRLYTNSIKTTDLSIVNAFAYPEYRILAEAGIQLFELSDKQGPEQLRSSLHMKGGYYLNKSGLRVIVGSYNLDPRSHARDTNNALVLWIPDAEKTLVKEKMDAAFNTSNVADLNKLAWLPITVENDAEATEKNLLNLEKIANEEGNKKTRRMLLPFKVEL